MDRGYMQDAIASRVGQRFHRRLDQRAWTTQKEMFVFFDTGVRNAVLRQHRNVFNATELGKLFEQWFICQIIAFISYHKKSWKYYFYRDDAKNEVDLILDLGQQVLAIEVEYAKSFKNKYLDGLQAFAQLCKKPTRSILIYRGENSQCRGNVEVIPYETFLLETIFSLP